MKRPMTLSREIESIQAKIAERRRDRARIDSEISNLLAISKAKMAALVGVTLERWDLSDVPVQTLLRCLAKVTEDAIHKPTSPAPAADLQVFVKFGRNASPLNREKLMAAGLHWNGREGGWVGNCTAAQISDLRQTFGGRLEKPEAIPAEGDPGISAGGAQETLSSDADTMAKSSDDSSRSGTTVFSNDLNASGRLPPPPGFPHWRMPVT